MSAFRITRSLGRTMPTSAATMNTHTGVSIPARARTMRSAASMEQIARSAHSMARPPSRSPSTPNIGAKSVPSSCSEPKAVSSSTEPVCTITYQPRAEHLRVGGEQGEALVDDPSLDAERSNIAVPAEASEAAVLHERGRFGAGGRHLLEVLQGDVAHAEEPRAASVPLLRHRGPDLGVVVGPAVAGRGPVEHVAVDVVGPEVLERAGHRLGDLRRKVGRRVVG